jgi:hypothetical protein
MIDSSPLGQDQSSVAVDDVRHALTTLATAAQELDASHHVDLPALVPAYLAIRPTGHRLATTRTIDLALLGRSLALVGEPLSLGASRFVLSTVRAAVMPTVVDEGGSLLLTLPESDHACADALAFALGLVVERAKAKRILGEMPSSSLDVTARLLGVTSDALVAHFGSPERAMAALSSLSRGSLRASLHRVPRDETRRTKLSELDRAPSTGPLFIVAGAIERIHDMLSPFVRRLETELTALAGSPDDDALYASLVEIVTRDPLAHDERLTVEEADGIAHHGDHLVVSFRALDVRFADARARAALEKLASQDATLVLTSRTSRGLAEVLARVGTRARAVILLDEGFTDGATPYFPDVIVSATSMHAIENPFARTRDDATTAHVAFCAPGLGLAPADPPGTRPDAIACALLASMIDVVVRARALGQLHRACRTACAVVLPGDDLAASAIALACLEKMAASAPRA